MTSEFTPKDHWRAIILYGLNTATYKMALGRCLLSFVEHGQTHVPLCDLAEAFFDLYRERLLAGRPQLATPGRITVMERLVSLHRTGALDRGAAIDRVAREAFGDVIPRFHTLAGGPAGVRFYDHTAEALVLTDTAFKVLAQGKDELLTELGSRWDLLEASFTLQREEGELANDIRQFYLTRGYERTNITHMRDALWGYQGGTCFYCGEQMALGQVHVDHVLPRQLLYHDEPWNLVLAHPFCNEQKSDLLPGDCYVRKLVERNENLIASNHPLKTKLLQQLGATADKRERKVWGDYEEARTVLRHTWEGIRGYHPETDEFYRAVVRNLVR